MVSIRPIQGPSEIIKDGHNGLLVENGNIAFGCYFIGNTKSIPDFRWEPETFYYE